MKELHDAQHQQVRKEEARHRDQRVGDERGDAVVARAPLQRGVDAGWKRQRPNHQGGAHEQGQ